jgi:hypothetical protein
MGESCEAYRKSYPKKLMKAYKVILTFFIIILSLSVYLLTLKAVPGNIDSSSTLIDAPFEGNTPPTELSHERSSYATMLALDEKGTTELDLNLGDLGAPDTGFYKGKIYSYFPPGVAVMALPFYKIGKNFNMSLAFAYFSESFVATLTLIVLFFICINIFNLPIWTSLFVTFLTGFGSNFLNFSITLYQHIPTVFLMLVAFYSSWKYRQDKNLSWIWASFVWIAYGLSSFLDYPNLILFLPIMVYFASAGIITTEQEGNYGIKIKPSFIFTFIFLILVGGGHMYYNYTTFGNWKTFSNTFETYDPRNPDKTYEALILRQNNDTLREGTESVGVFKENRLINGIYVLLFQLDKSLFMHSPFYIISILAIYHLRKKLTAEYITIISMIILNIFVYSSFHDPWGGWAFGPRYLVPSIPFLAILFGYWLNVKGASFLKKITALLFFIYGSAVALSGALGRGITVPKRDAVFDNLPTTYLSNISYIKDGENGSLIFNSYISDKLTLVDFYFVFLLILTFITFLVLFIMSKFEKQNV